MDVAACAHTEAEQSGPGDASQPTADSNPFALELWSAWKHVPTLTYADDRARRDGDCKRTFCPSARIKFVGRGEAAGAIDVLAECCHPAMVVRISRHPPGPPRICG